MAQPPISQQYTAGYAQGPGLQQPGQPQPYQQPAFHQQQIQYAASPNYQQQYQPLPQPPPGFTYQTVQQPLYQQAQALPQMPYASNLAVQQPQGQAYQQAMQPPPSEAMQYQPVQVPILYTMLYLI